MSFTKLNGKTIELEYKLGGSLSTGPSGYRFTTKAQLQDAVNQWCQEPRPISAQQYRHISTWDVSQITDMSNLFQNKTNFNDDISNWNVSKVTTMGGMFWSARAFNQPLDQWTVSNVTTMKAMFLDASVFNQPLDLWTVSNVTTMAGMFFNASAFNQPLGQWNVSNVTNMVGMFMKASSFNHPLERWNVSNVTDMKDMFMKASSFNQPLERWNVSNVTSMKAMFSHASSFNQPLERWNVSNATNMDDMFDGATAFNDGQYNAPQPGQVRPESTGPPGYRFNTKEELQTAVNEWCQYPQPTSAQQYGHISTWDVSQITDMSNLFKNKTDFNDDISGWDVSNVTTMERMFLNAEAFDQSLELWDVSNVTTMERMFLNAEAFNQPLERWNVVNVTTMKKMFNDASSFNHPLERWNVVNVTTMYGMFFQASAFNQPLERWNVVNVTTMYGMFWNASAFNKPLERWNVVNVTNMKKMFNDASSFNHPLERWNVVNVTTMERMFYGASSFNQPMERWNVSNATNIDEMFDGATAFNDGQYNAPQPGQVRPESTGPPGYRFNTKEDLQTAVNEWCQNPQPTSAQQYRHISTWDVSQITDMSKLFINKTNFNDDISNWNVSKVTTMKKMFNGASSFNQPLERWNVSNVTTMKAMFLSASAFNQPLEHWNVSTVTTMTAMFFNASVFNEPLEHWNVSNVTSMDGMFLDASAFNQHLEHWNVSNVTTMKAMFSHASSFNHPLERWNVSNVTSMRAMFSHASSFNHPLERWNVSNATNIEMMFDSATAFNNGQYNAPQPGQIGVIQTLPISYQQFRSTPSDIALLSGNEIRKKLKNYVSSAEHIIRLSDFNVGNKLAINFYKQLRSNLVNVYNFKKVWSVQYVNADILIDNIDFGGYSKALFSHFAKYCLFYDQKLYSKKEKELEGKLNKLKDDYKNICESKAYLLNPGTGPGVTGISQSSEKLEGYNYLKKISIQNPFLKLEMESYCKQLDLLNKIDLNNIPDDVIYHYLEKDLDENEKSNFKVGQGQKNYWDKRSAKGTKAALKVKKDKLIRLEKATVPIWWKKVKKIVLSEHSKLLEDQQNLDKEIKNINFLPFENISDSYSNFLKINKKLDKDLVKTLFPNVESFYNFVGSIFGKYITQELPVWRGEGEVQYARDYIPIGHFLLLLILKKESKLSRNTIYEAIMKDHGKNKVKIIEDLYTYNKYGIEGNSEVSTLPSPSQEEMVKTLESLRMKNFIELCCYFYINKMDEMSFLRNFLDGAIYMINQDTDITPEQLIQAALECQIDIEKNKLVNLLEKEKENTKFTSEELNRLNIFIDIVKDLEDEKLKDLLDFFTGLKCAPNNIYIEFNKYNSLFKGHLCSNGLEIPLTSGYQSNPEIQYDTKKKLKEVLLETLEVNQLVN
jgi:trimeric autotransporter adhesin